MKAINETNERDAAPEAEASDADTATPDLAPIAPEQEQSAEAAVEKTPPSKRPPAPRRRSDRDREGSKAEAAAHAFATQDDRGRDPGAEGKTAKGKTKVAVMVKRATLEYETQLNALQVELLKLQNHVKAEGLRVVLIFEGRDAAGKGGTIKRVTEHMNPRGARVVALETPSDRERTQWYFQRYVAHLPAAGEIVLFDRSWYNRAMVEPVMGFCTDEQNKRFLKDVPMFEHMLVKDGVHLFKFYFSVSKKEQLARFRSRKTDLLKQYKISPVDEQAQDYWNQYTVKKFQMLTETNRSIAPWTIVRSDDKKLARLNCIKFILQAFAYSGRIGAEELEPDPKIIISGIDELKMMEDNLFKPNKLAG